MRLQIELAKGKWHVNGNTFQNMSIAERQILSKFIAEINLEIENETINQNQKK